MKDSIGYKSNNQKSPAISVLLPVYGYSKYLPEAIESILNQTFKDFELIIIEDPRNSKFENELTLEKYLGDSRITYLKNESRRGLVNSLNNGISLSRGKYIARQDADDISVPDRLSLQYIFLKSNDCTVVGGNMMVIDGEGKMIGYRKYPGVVSGKALLLRDLVAHPTVMFDKDIVISLGGYNKKMECVEDYDLWMRILSNDYKIHNLSNYLIKYRHHRDTVKFGAFKKSVLNTLKLQIFAIRNYKNVKLNFLFPIYFAVEILFLVLPKNIGYSLFEKLAVKSK